MSSKKVMNYVGGEWVEPENGGWLDVENPSTGEVIGQCPLSTRAAVDSAIEAAAGAYPEWSRTPVARRAQYMAKLAELLRENEEALTRVMTLENGKSLPDAQAEVKRALENCEVASGMPTLIQGVKVMGCSFGIDGEVLRLPVGVFGMIAPFNFPAMVPFWFLPYALAAGNAMVVKASEQVPLSMQFVGELIDQTGLPAGVFSLINGDRTAAEALVANPNIKGISLVGNSKTCRVVGRKCAEGGKRFLGMGSAKNHLVVMPDAKVDEVIRNMITSCYGCAGQRCMASSAIVAVGREMYERICEKFVSASREVIVANPLDEVVAGEAMVMGPVISARSKEFILSMIEKGCAEGAHLALDGRGLVVKGCEQGHFVGPTVFTDVKPGMAVHRTEIFGPVVVILQAETLDEAIGIINEHEYGNGASIYTQNGYWARKFKLETLCGMIGVNVGIPAPVAYLPFGGMKESLFADIKAQSRSVIDFYTESKVITERYWQEQ
ncbi:MAG: CoA-acylating methylmalonate-semialdehyde dehydrogenase [Sedimentisphaerales bacterium]|nr:CoA-acylating methylmalonate-semialdehyde dehydrogenase [Sedimentisphaerales bacterium]